MSWKCDWCWRDNSQKRVACTHCGRDNEAPPWRGQGARTGEWRKRREAQPEPA